MYLKKNAAGAAVRVDTIQGIAPATAGDGGMPDTNSYGRGLAALRCMSGAAGVGGTTTWYTPATLAPNQGPPSYLVVAPSSAEPVVTLLNILSGASVANSSTFLSKRLALAVLNLTPMTSPPGLSFAQFQAALLACAPRISLSGDANVADPALVVSAAGQAFQGQVDFAAANVVQNQCTPSAVSAFKNAFNGMVRHDFFFCVFFKMNAALATLSRAEAVLATPRTAPRATCRPCPSGFHAQGGTRTGLAHAASVTAVLNGIRVVDRALGHAGLQGAL